MVAQASSPGFRRDLTIIVEKNFTHLSPSELTIQRGDRVVLTRPGVGPEFGAFRVKVSPATGVFGLSTQLEFQHVLRFDDPGTYTLEVTAGGSIPRDIRGQIIVRAGPEHPAIATAPPQMPPRAPSPPTPATPPRVAAPPTPPPTPAPAPALAPADRERPEISIAYPKDELKVTEPTVAVAGVVQDNVALAEVELTVNRQRIDLSGAPRPGQPARSYPLDVDVPLVLGRNLIVVTARDLAGNVQREARTVIREQVVVAPAAPPTPALPRVDLRAFYGESWAVLIGINQYRYVEPLRYAVNDAIAMRDMLMRQGFRPERIFTLFDGQATREAIMRLLGDQLPRMVGSNDRLLIFFAGHGETREPRPRVDQGFLIPVDGRRESLGATAIDWLGDLRRVLVNTLAAKHVLFIADACYSGYGATRDLGVVPTLSRAGSLTARQVLTAGGKGERVIEEGGQGLFTRILLRGLEGAADRNGDGVVTASELANYVREHVPAASGNRQTPNFAWLDDGEGDFIIATVQK